MSKKRSSFEIDFDLGDSEPAPEPNSVPAGTDGAAGQAGRLRRGPMASAISENAAALSDREAAAAKIREENDRLAHEYVRLKKEGLIVDRIPVDKVLTTKLTRDRTAKRDPELDELKASIVAVGLSNPIRVEPVSGGEYQLIQGWRRLSAYRELYRETGDPLYAAIPAGLMARGSSLPELYQRMVDENLVRRDISFAEMAKLAMTYVDDPNTPTSDLREAVDLLYASANRQKRVYIRRFADVLNRVGGALKYPEALARQLGLDLAKRLDEDPGFAERLVEVVSTQPKRDAEAEVMLLRQAMKPTRERAGGQGLESSAKTTIRIAGQGGVTKCTAVDGRLELQSRRDFSTVDRQRLEAAVRAFLDALEGEG